jgi:hypothetical protein
MIDQGAIDIHKIIKTHPEKRKEKEIAYLAYYLTEKIAFFRNEDFLGKDFMVGVAKKLQYECHE